MRDAIDLALTAPEPPARLAGARSAARPLTRRERQVAALILRGHTNREIAEALFIAERTVDTHVEHILAKLGFKSRTQVAAWAADDMRATVEAP